ncbi:Hypothetical protein AJAP_22490 [Amycolatopsis japonica]|uniref:Uncharacterized protein n=1 Tax=Amycolatopsis japonica TaxID=208439 RepID=A0A075UWG9_9PSEU|nr:hypothetical protein [Amycolatopsis japonica]AIG77353.1 Hypothetical protein AJAP_22490 [Amycolatopsis japonica]
MTTKVHEELREGLADETAKNGTYDKSDGNSWDGLEQVPAYIKPESLPEELRPAYIVATTAPEAVLALARRAAGYGETASIRRGARYSR